MGLDAAKSFEMLTHKWRGKFRRRESKMSPLIDVGSGQLSESVSTLHALLCQEQSQRLRFTFSAHG